MSPKLHKLYIWSFVAITIGVAVILALRGWAFYNVGIADRFHHADYDKLKPSGLLGHGYGIIGTLLILTGIFTYMARKRLRVFSRIGVLKYWLEFHIFLCSLGPILVLYHTSFKFGGIVSVSFWSMVAVVLSGVLGRYIYLQIPRTIEGRALSLGEVNNLKDEFKLKLTQEYGIEDAFFDLPARQNREAISRLKAELKTKQLTAKEIRKALSYFKSEKSLGRRIKRLERMQNLFRYWHVAHLPFALIMLIIMVIHVVITIIFGYRWVF
ncbi:hypothetical protein [Saccharicrinis sp. FJH54]|uniref:hypothetical protein n=1 Tax=Saccharicrinis sp. FJH54 TaxID=3344665 RepID=UPI0035D48B15